MTLSLCREVPRRLGVRRLGGAAPGDHPLLLPHLVLSLVLSTLFWCAQGKTKRRAVRVKEREQRGACVQATMQLDAGNGSAWMSLIDLTHVIMPLGHTPPPVP